MGHVGYTAENHHLQPQQGVAALHVGPHKHSVPLQQGEDRLWCVLPCTAMRKKRIGTPASVTALRCRSRLRR
ncbi:MAG: hypothetical protein OXQ90_16920 [Gammaproteobacteria bacterium]|nr:hypothetical protein [Gammaproteobacteria bacterium]